MSQKSEPVGQLPREVLVEERTSAPVKWWAAMGVIFLSVEAYVLLSWVFGPNFTPTPTGPTPVPGWMVVSARINEAIAVVLLVVFTYVFLFRPWRRERKMSLDGMFFLAFLLSVWQDPLLNYTQAWATYNSAFINYGNWLGSVPGVLWPTAHKMAEPILWIWFGYGVASLGLVIVINAIMRWAKARWPHMGTIQMLLVCYAASTVLFLILENIWMRMGVYTYAGAIQSWSLFAGHYDQYPLYEGVFGGFAFACWAALRYFYNDKGQTIAERGIDQVKASPRAKTGLRFLAVCGAIQAVMFFGYNIPHAWFALHADTWPKDITDRSYFTDQMCGPGTDYACPGPGVPIPRPDSAHVTNDGQFKVPAGTQLPGPG